MRACQSLPPPFSGVGPHPSSGPSHLAHSDTTAPSLEVRQATRACVFVPYSCHKKRHNHKIQTTAAMAASRSSTLADGAGAHIERLERHLGLLATRYAVRNDRGRAARHAARDPRARASRDGGRAEQRRHVTDGRFLRRLWEGLQDVSAVGCGGLDHRRRAHRERTQDLSPGRRARGLRVRVCRFQARRDDRARLGRAGERAELRSPVGEIRNDAQLAAVVCAPARRCDSARGWEGEVARRASAATQSRERETRARRQRAWHQGLGRELRLRRRFQGGERL